MSNMTGDNGGGGAVVHRGSGPALSGLTASFGDGSGGTCSNNKNSSPLSHPRRRKLRSMGRECSYIPRDKAILGLMVILASLYITFLGITHSTLEQHDERNQGIPDGQYIGFFGQDRAMKYPRISLERLAMIRNLRNHNNTIKDGTVGETKRSDADSNRSYVGERKFLIFKGFLSGQGVGNVISGLLAAHLLGIEFDRIVCVAESYTDFYLAFEMVHPDTLRYCPEILHERKELWEDKSELIISLINFSNPPDECQLQTSLASDQPILVLFANTYPRWPGVPDNFFFTYYRAKPELIGMLPYDANHPPHTVVHLRVPDDTNGDRRKGLDEASFQALGRLLPSDTYLVTNRVAYYDYFREKFGWRHPHWSEIFHTALGRSWGGKDVDGSHHFFESPAQRPDTKIDRKQHIMENWADWYTILCATMVYHTHSDFSISAVHWQNVPSKSIDGMQGGNLLLLDESYIRDGLTERLIDRRVDASGTRQLRHCRG